MKHHSSRFMSLVDDAKKHIKEISPQILKNKIDLTKNILL